MNRPAYGEIPPLWDADGALRDVYVLQAGLGEWRKFMDFAAGFACTYSFDGDATAFPGLEQVFAEQRGTHLLRIQIGDAIACAHFFTITEIELDLDPGEIRTPKAHDEVLAFMEGLAKAVGKPVLLTPENGSHVPYLSYEPARGIWRRHA